MTNEFKSLLHNSNIHDYHFISAISGFDPRVGRPRLAEWLGAVRELTNPAYDEAHSILYRLREKENQ